MTGASHGEVRRAAGDLARLESRKLVASPAFLAGVGIALTGIAMFLQAAGDRFSSWSDDGWTVAAGFMILAILGMVATNRAALRDQREHTTEQHSVLPLDPWIRTEALVRALALPAALVAGMVATILAAGSALVGISPVEVLHAAQLPLLVPMFGALGIALARWLPSAFVAPVAAFGFYVISPGEAVKAWHVIWPFATPGGLGPAMWHLVYVVALAFAFGSIAVGRHGWRRPIVIVLVVAVAAIGVSVAVMIAGVCPPSGPCRL